MEFAACVGWDWADKEHEVVVHDCRSGRRTRMKVEGSAEALHEWAAKMCQRFGGGKIAVAIETSRGAVVAALMNYDHLILYPINPKSVSNYREIFHPSGKKDDPVDAEALLKLILQNRDDFRPLMPADETTREISMLSEQRRKLVEDRKRAASRLRSNLKGYFPQALELIAEDLYAPLSLDFLSKWPTLQSVKRARVETIESFYLSHNSRSQSKNDARLCLISSTVPLTSDPAVMGAATAVTEGLVDVIRAMNSAIQKLDERITSLYVAHADYELINSLPGAGEALGPRLIGLLGEDRDRYEGASDLQRLTGIAPITRRTGGKNGSISVIRRIRRSKFLHQTIVEWAGQFYLNSEWGRAFYDHRKEKGHSHWRIMRALGFKLLRILFHCWKHNTPYDEQYHQEQLRRSGSPIVPRLAA